MEAGLQQWMTVLRVLSINYVRRLTIKTADLETSAYKILNHWTITSTLNVLSIFIQQIYGRVAEDYWKRFLRFLFAICLYSNRLPVLVELETPQW